MAEVAREHVLFLLDASSAFDRRILLAWIARNCPEGTGESGFEALEIPPSRRRRRLVSLAKLEARLASDGDPLLAPLRVAWIPRKREGERRARLTDLLRGDP